MSDAIVIDKFKILKVYIFYTIIRSNSFDRLTKLILDKTEETSYLLSIRYFDVTQVQLSINVTNHFAPNIDSTIIGPYTLE